MIKVGILEDTASLREFILRNHHAARKHTERAFHDAHIAIHDDMRNAGLTQDCIDIG